MSYLTASLQPVPAFPVAADVAAVDMRILWPYNPSPKLLNRCTTAHKCACSQRRAHARFINHRALWLHEAAHKGFDLRVLRACDSHARARTHTHARTHAHARSHARTQGPARARAHTCLRLCMRWGDDLSRKALPGSRQAPSTWSICAARAVRPRPAPNIYLL